MKQHKFILYDGKIIFGRVRFHKELLPEKYDMSKVFGGGMFNIDSDNKIVTLFGKSQEFGKFADNIKEFKIDCEYIKDYTIIIDNDI